MPNLDGGHYFLTVLAPVRVDPVKPVHADATFEEARSHAQLLALQLSVFPVGRQTAHSPPHGPASPFARNTLNHTARFAIIDSPNFNGRLSGDTLLQRSNPLAPQPVDRLATPFLLFAADIDAGVHGHSRGEAALLAYAEELWRTMRDELQRVFGHCYGFSETVTDAASFHAYLKKCQVETSLSFNDYWADNMPTKDKLKVVPLAVAIGLTVILSVIWVILLIINGLRYMLTGTVPDFNDIITNALDWPSLIGLFLVPVLIIGVLLTIGVTYWRIQSHGRKPFPAAPNSDLPSILKALYLQQAYARFATQAQGLAPADLHARFGEFLASVRPDEPQPALQAGECYPPEWKR